MTAAHNSNTELVRFLLGKGANASFADKVFSNQNLI